MLSRVGLIHDSLVAETFRPRADFRTRLMALYPGIPDPPLPAGTCMARVVSSSRALAEQLAYYTEGMCCRSGAHPSVLLPAAPQAPSHWDSSLCGV